MFQQCPSSVRGQKADSDYVESDGSSLLERTIEALHMELLFVKQRIAVKLANLGQEPEEVKKSAKKEKVIFCNTFCNKAEAIPALFKLSVFLT